MIVVNIKKFYPDVLTGRVSAVDAMSPPSDLVLSSVRRRHFLAASAWTTPIIANTITVPRTTTSELRLSAYTPQLRFMHLSTWKLTTYVPGYSLTAFPWHEPGYMALTGIQGNTSVMLPEYHTSSYPVDDITLTISIPLSAGFIETPATVLSDNGWSAGSVSVAGNDVRYAFMWSGHLDTTENRKTPQLEFMLPAMKTNVAILEFPINIISHAYAREALAGIIHTSIS